MSAINTPARLLMGPGPSIEVGGGLGPYAGQIWRIGLMGETCRASSIAALSDALDHILTTPSS